MKVFKSCVGIALLLSVVAIGCKGKEKAPEASSAVSTVEKAVAPEVVPNPDSEVQVSAEETSQETPRYNKTLPDSLFASIERTPCFGRCPTYKVMIFKSGYATYEGKRFAVREGFFQSRFTRAEMDQIKKEADAIGYYQLKNEYDGPITDIPATFTAVDFGKGIKSVKNRYEAPDELRNYEKFLDRLIEERNWKSAEKPQSQD